jgi:NAD(P)-dependent dehydrogenase (short-subunit alcohol dehydrogenase family)
MTVVVHGRDEPRTKAVAEGIRSTGGLAEIAIGDLSTDGGADKVASAATASGGIDILVNNAGAYHHLAWMDATPDRWIETYQSNVVSGVRMIHRLVPAMRERRWGRVIQIGGGLAIQPIPMQPDYEASLAARHNLAVSLARELKGTGVTSNVLAPGAILVESVEKLLVDIAPVIAAVRRSWRSAVSTRGEARDDRLVGTRHQRIFRLDGNRRSGLALGQRGARQAGHGRPRHRRRHCENLSRGRHAVRRQRARRNLHAADGVVGFRLSLPHEATGKIFKRKLRDPCWEGRT